jgi:hypothetical protein
LKGTQTTATKGPKNERKKRGAQIYKAAVGGGGGRLVLVSLSHMYDFCSRAAETAKNAISDQNPAIRAVCCVSQVPR